MATAPNALTPPPQMDDSSAAPASPTSPIAASPAPPQPSPAMQKGAQDIILVVQTMRGIAKAYPAAAPIVSEINDKLREILPIVMQSQTPGEPMAPPLNG